MADKQAAEAGRQKHIPATILTGFLGSGKTTLLNKILHENHGLKIAVIENEFGEEGIDNDLLMQQPGEQIVEMNNGCICCTVRGDLVRILGGPEGAPRQRRDQVRPGGDRDHRPCRSRARSPRPSSWTTTSRTATCWMR